MSSRFPETSVQELARQLKGDQPPMLLDVREQYEIDWVKFPSPAVIFAPMSDLARRGPQALPDPVMDKSAAIVVLCHHGVRSAEVTAWLLQMGWQNVTSLAGGLDAYARLIDPSIGRY